MRKDVECCLKQYLTNCSKKAGIPEKEVERLLNNEDNPFVALDDIKEVSVQNQGADLAFLKEKFGDQVDPKITLDEYIDFDNEVSTTHGKITN